MVVIFRFPNRRKTFVMMNYIAHKVVRHQWLITRKTQAVILVRSLESDWNLIMAWNRNQFQFFALESESNYLLGESILGPKLVFVNNWGKQRDSLECKKINEEFQSWEAGTMREVLQVETLFSSMVRSGMMNTSDARFRFRLIPLGLDSTSPCSQYANELICIISLRANEGLMA